MPRSNGSYALPNPPYPFKNGTTADATDVDTVLTDIANALTGSLASDGTTPWTGDQNANGQKITNLGTATSPTDAVSLQQAQSFGASFRNALLNGSFSIWQRGTSMSVTSGTVYGPDRWQVASGIGSAVSVSKAASGANFARSVTGSTPMQVFQNIEGVSTFAGQSVVLSFTASCDAGGQMQIGINQVFGTGGTPSGTVANPGGTVTLSAAPQRYTVPVNLTSIAGKTLGTNGDDALSVLLSIDQSVGNCVLNLSQIQLEQANAATPFDTRPISIELLMCQRYYAKGTINEQAYLQAGAAFAHSVKLPTTMRALPALTNTFTVTNVTSPSFGVLDAANAAVAGTVTANGTYQMSGPYTASADL